ADDLLERLGAVLHPFVQVHSRAVAGEADDVWEPGFAGRVDGCANLAQALVPVLLAVEALWDRVSFHHAADQAVLFEGREFLGLDQIDPLVSLADRDAAQVIERDLGVAPAADGLLDAVVVNDAAL